MSNWNFYIKNFVAYLKIERSLSSNSVEAYLHDVQLLVQYLNIEKNMVNPEDLMLKDC